MKWGKKNVNSEFVVFLKSACSTLTESIHVSFQSKGMYISCAAQQLDVLDQTRIAEKWNAHALKQFCIKCCVWAPPLEYVFPQILYLQEPCSTFFLLTLMRNSCDINLKISTFKIFRNDFVRERCKTNPPALRIQNARLRVECRVEEEWWYCTLARATTFGDVIY